MEEEFEDIQSKNGWRLHYKKICIESRNHEFSAEEALKTDNKHLNRYRDVYPYDHSRVSLSNLQSTDYINASKVVAKIGPVSRSYVLTQGPLEVTAGHYWWMIWEQKSKAVVMLNRVIEKGTVKCYQYWPDSVGETMMFTDVGLKVENVSTLPGQHYNITTLRLSRIEEEESREVLHFHYTTWPDFGVPTCPDTFLEYLGAVRDSGCLSHDDCPPVVHCSAGIGRSGTFILVDTCLLEAEQSGPEAVNIKNRLLEMRTYRMGLIQTEDQLKFSYLSIIEGARQMGLVTSVSQVECQIAESDSEDSQDDIPPPLPPPRTESLKKEDETSDDVTKNNTDSEQFNGLPNNLEVQEEGVMNNISVEMKIEDDNQSMEEQSSSSTCILTSDKLGERKREMELKRRKKVKDEERSVTETKITEIKAAIKKAEEWNSNKEYMKETVFPFCVGLFMFCVGGYYYFRA